MSLQDDYIRYETRRQFFSRGKNVLGWSALASLLGEAMTDKLMAVGNPAATAHKPLFPHFAPAGETGHLSAHGRRAVADGPVRLQAGHEATGTTRICPTACAAASGSRP